jgi:hypothetical protein
MNTKYFLALSLMIAPTMLPSAKQSQFQAPKNDFIHHQIDSSYNKILERLDSAYNRLDSICRLLDSPDEQLIHPGKRPKH